MTSPKPRARDLGIPFEGTPGPLNAITDVPGLWVGHKTLIYDRPRIARTGLTVIVPREGHIWRDNAFAAFHSFNGCGELTGMHWLAESGLLCYPIVLTNTHQVGTAQVVFGQGVVGVHGHRLLEMVDGQVDLFVAFRDTADLLSPAAVSVSAGRGRNGCVGGHGAETA